MFTVFLNEPIALFDDRLEVLYTPRDAGGNVRDKVFGHPKDAAVLDPSRDQRRLHKVGTREHTVVGRGGKA